MVDVEDQVREMLRRRAGDVPIHVEAPPGMLRRAWRRILMAFTGAAVAVAVVAAGAVAGVRLLNQNVNVPVTPAEAAPACRASDLQGSPRLVGASGHIGGSLLLTNVSGNPCSLLGQPALVIVDANGDLDLHEESTDPSWVVRSKPTPKGWPVVTLYYGASASIRIEWTSWCGPAKPTEWRIVLPGGGMLHITIGKRGDLPPCKGSSRLQVGPFEPVT